MRRAPFVLCALVAAAACNGGGGLGDRGGAPAAFDIFRASVSTAGAEGSGSSDTPALSDDGLIVAFASFAPDLVGGDANGVQDVFVRDEAGPTTERASLGDAGGEGDFAAGEPAIARAGEVVAFVSASTDLVAGDSNGEPDVFVRDLAAATTVRASVADGGGGAEADGPSEAPALSEDGTRVAFASRAANLTAGDTNAVFDVFVRDLSTGSTERASVSGAGAQANAESREPSISGDGTLVAFSSLASNLVGGDSNGAFDIFVRDLSAGTTRRVSLTNAGLQANGDSTRPAISRDGRFVAFVSTATNLVPGDVNGVADVFVRDLAALSTARVSVGSGGLGGDGASGRPSISADGRLVAFESAASNLVADDANGASDVFVRDAVGGTTARASVAADGTEGAGQSVRPSISADGARVAFASNAANLVPMDGNSAFDVFVAPNPLLQ